MSENIMKVSKNDVKQYWKTFFLDKNSEKEINDMIESVSNTNMDKILDEKRDEQITDTFIWNETQNEKEIIEILNKLEKGNEWVYIYEPIIKKESDRLIQHINNNEIIEDKKGILSQIITAIVAQLHSIAYQTIIAEIFYAKQNNLLKGETKEERGKYFAEVLTKDNVFRKELYNNYPELARLLDIKVKYTVDFLLKALDDTEKNILNIEKDINDNIKLGKIDKLRMGEGDTHNKGKSVISLLFDSGKTIIYKPHSLDIDLKYYKFTEWLNKKTNAYKVKRNLSSPKIFTIDDAGWAEFVEYKPCTEKEEIKRFYSRIGRILCVLHSLNGNDMHYENIIASGEIPYLIDLETLIHPNFEKELEGESALEKVFNEVRDSVSQTHLLPSRIVNSKNNKVLDIGGLGAHEEQEAPFMSKYVENYGSDDIKIEKRYGKIRPKNNNPLFNNEKVNSLDFKNEIIIGFKELYEWIMKNKNEYKSIISELFGKCEIRALHRATNVYAQLLGSSYHPDLLTSFKDRFVFLHRIAYDYKDKNPVVIRQEIEDMVYGDIPYFTADIDNTFFHATRMRNIDTGIEHDTLNRILKKIDKMSEVKLYRQIAAINTAFMGEDYNGHVESGIKWREDGVRRYKQSEILVKAEDILEHIIAKSIDGSVDGKKNRTWLTSSDTGLGFRVFAGMTADLYSGLSGAAMALNSMFKATNKQKYKEITEEVVNSMLESVSDKFDLNEFKDVKVGGFTGIAGMIYMLSKVENQNNLEKYREDIKRVLKIILNKIEDDTSTCDVIGIVGTLSIMLNIYERANDLETKDMTMNISKKIISRIKENTFTDEKYKGVYWNEKGHSGYAHGNAGVVVQLYRYYLITKDVEILELMKAGLEYEREMFCLESNNWNRGKEEKYICNGWCHGSPGILLSKIQLKKLGYNDEKIDEEIKISIKNVVKEGLSKDISLCHGDAGNLSILKEAAIVLGDKELYNQAVATMEDLADFIIKYIGTQDVKGLEKNELMIGLSGIVHELARIGEEKNIPNILGLE